MLSIWQLLRRTPSTEVEVAPHNMELAVQLVELVGRLTEERPEVNLHVIRCSTDERLVYIERCRIYLQSRNKQAKKMMCSSWSALDVDDQFELNELAYWQTDTHRVKSLLSLAKKGQFCPTVPPHSVEQLQPKIEEPWRPNTELRRQGSRASSNGFEHRRSSERRRSQRRQGQRPQSQRQVRSLSDSSSNGRTVTSRFPPPNSRATEGVSASHALSRSSSSSVSRYSELSRPQGSESRNLTVRFPPTNSRDTQSDTAQSTSTGSTYGEPSRPQGSNSLKPTSRFSPASSQATEGGVGESTSSPGTASQGNSSGSTQRTFRQLPGRHEQSRGQTKESCPAKNGVSGTQTRLCL
uniref:Uncharacterized protein n=1 Tax=Noctiluca scintillans TaxID=2966 RepID=A0A7S1APU5_NOCSC|mmetsp:Transcript_54194/g.144810  ORF Transcript_54194/g.144810 Transcript_54194/m.144810 type:complete len:352 (+) Transcript_54194:36-1091(+)